MSGVATAIGGAAIAGAIVSSNASNRAAGAMSDAANQSNATTMAMFNQQQANNMPYMQAGTKALGEINANMPRWNSPFTMSDFHEDPGYKFDLAQGQEAIQRSAGANSGLISGASIGALNNYSQNMASNEYANAYNRYQQQIDSSYNRLAGIANLGEAAGANTNAAGMNAANNISQNTIGAGNANAAATVGTANAISGGLSTAANGFMMSNMMGNLNRSQTPGISGGAPSMGTLSSSLSMPQIGQSAGYAPQSSTISALY